MRRLGCAVMHALVTWGPLPPGEAVPRLDNTTGS